MVLRIAYFVYMYQVPPELVKIGINLASCSYNKKGAHGHKKVETRVRLNTTVIKGNLRQLLGALLPESFSRVN